MRFQRTNARLHPANAAGMLLAAIAAAWVPSAAVAATLPAPLFELKFEDGLALTNTGTGGAAATLLGNTSLVNFVPGVAGQAIDLGNTTGGSAGNQKVQLGQALPDVGTISTWYYARPFYNYQTVYDNSVNADWWEMWIYNTGQLRTRINTSGAGDVSYTLPASPGANNWYHIAYTWDRNNGTGTAASLYVNGQLRASDDIPSWTVPGTLFIGGGNAGNTSGNGYWDQFRIYDVRLDAAQVAYEFGSVPVVRLSFERDLVNSGWGGPAYNGTLVDGPNGITPQYVSGRVHTALRLDNVQGASTGGDYVSVNYTMTDEGTVALWYKPTAWYNYQSIFDNSVHPDQWEFWIYQDGIARFRVGGGSEVSYDLDNLGGPDQWYHLAVTWKRTGSTVETQLFVDGLLRDTRTTGAWTAPGATFFLGGGNDGNMYGRGAFDDLYIFQRVLTANEVFGLYSVPEPATLVLMGLGMLAAPLWRRRGPRKA